MPTVDFDYTAAAYSGAFHDVRPGGFPAFGFSGRHSRIDMLVTGTAFALDCRTFDANDNLLYSIDGGAWTAFSTPESNVPATVTIYTGQTDVQRHVAIETIQFPLGFLWNVTACFHVTGAAPACVPYETNRHYMPCDTATDFLGRPGILNHARLETGFIVDDTTLDGYTVLHPGIILNGSDDSASGLAYGSQFRFAATIGTLEIWCRHDGQKWALAIDKVIGLSVQTPALDKWDWFTLATGLDTAHEHTYGVISSAFQAADYGFGSASIAEIRTTGGTGINVATQPAERFTLFEFGDSIIGNITQIHDLSTDISNYDTTLKFQMPLAEALDMQFYNSGASATTCQDFTGNLGTLSGPAVVGVTTQTGENRATDDAAEPTPAIRKVLIIYGTNDMGQIYVVNGRPAATVEEFQASYISMLNKLNAAIGDTIPFYCVGILPRYDFDAAARAPYSAAIQAAITAVGTANLHYVNPDAWGLAGVNDDDFSKYLDGVHPDTVGCQTVILPRLLAAMRPAGAGGVSRSGGIGLNRGFALRI